MSHDAQSRVELGVIALAAFVLGWDLWAVLVDLRISVGLDCQTHLPLRVLNGDLEWPGLFTNKTPLVGLLSLLAIKLLGVVPLATRLISVLCHVVLVAQTYDLGRRVGRSPVAGLWAALMMGTFPMVVGWARLDFPDFIVVCPITAALQLMVRIDNVQRLRQALLLGLVLGLGVLTKLTFALYLLGPGLFFACTRIRQRRGLLWSSLAVAVLLLVVAPWTLFNVDSIASLMVQSATDSGETVLQKARLYFSLPGVAGMIPAAVLAGVYLLLRRPADRWMIGLLLTFILGAMTLLVLIFDSASRYSIALFPTAAVLVGAGLPDLLERSGIRRWLTPVLAAAFLGVFIWFNLSPPTDPKANRELGAGMLTPDRRDHTGLTASLDLALRHGPEVLLVVDNHYTWENLVLPLLTHRFHGRRLTLVDLPRAKQVLASGRPLPVLLARFRSEMRLHADHVDHYFRAPSPHDAPGARPPPLVPGMKERYLWVLRQTQRRRLTTREDSYRIFLTTYLVQR